MIRASKNAEQRSSCGIGSKASLWCQAAPTPAPLATSTAAHSIQGGGSDAQSSYDSLHLVQHVATRQTRSTTLPLLTVPRTNTEFARRSYSYSAPFIWNSLPGDVLNCNSEHTFKKHLKTFLFTSCFYAAWLTPPLASASVASRMTLYKFDYCYYYYVITSFLTRNIVMTLNNVKAKVIAETTWYYWAISWFSNSHPSFAFRTICSWTRRNVVPESYE